MVTALVIFIITYLFIGLRQIPRVHIDRPAGALVGAVLMVVLGVLTLDEAFAAVDLHTILLLLGMMIITVYLRAAGFFELIAERIIVLSGTPLQLLVLVVISSAVLSALFVNDTICLLYTPIILEVTAQLAINPIPYLLALATASNIGSVMTITGNPQNMLIGIYSKIPYWSFFGALVPVALIGLAVVVIVLSFVYRKDLSRGRFDRHPSLPQAAVNRPLLARSLAVCGGVLVAFSLGYPYSLTAAAGAVVLMLIGGIRTERILEGVDWTLLLFFAGLFVVMHGVQVSGLAGRMIGWSGDLTTLTNSGRIAGISLVSAVLSNAVSNVPAVMLLRPFVEHLGGDRVAWLALAMSSTLAGNFSLIGSVANLIVVQQARKRVEIGFMEYFRAGALITIMTIAAGVLVLIIEVKIARGEEHAAAAPRRDMTVTVTASGTPGSTRIFRVALLCDTAEKQRRGLQGFRQLAAGEAALFPYPRPVEVTFWMGSVPYPIDIIFVSPDNTISRVFRDCRPGQTGLYHSGMPVRWVIETAAGSGVREGDRVRVK